MCERQRVREIELTGSKVMELCQWHFDGQWTGLIYDKCMGRGIVLASATGKTDTVVVYQLIDQLRRTK
jgi:hypothetical protein